ncbi:hypothetical protein OAB00_01945 [Akkermansiaceae bacterium]|nr:hypothetical protein [Akkermansiaceae bacterium]
MKKVYTAMATKDLLDKKKVSAAQKNLRADEDEVVYIDLPTKLKWQQTNGRYFTGVYESHTEDSFKLEGRKKPHPFSGFVPGVQTYCESLTENAE